MRALNPRVKRSGLIAALLAGVLLVSVGEAGAKGMGGTGGHVGLGNGRPPAFGNSMKSGNPGSGTSKPGKTYGHKHDHDRDRAERKEERKERKAEREERKREREERRAERKREHCMKSGTCPPKYVGKPIPGTPAPGGTKPPVVGTTGAPSGTSQSPGSNSGPNSGSASNTPTGGTNNTGRGPNGSDNPTQTK